jgi:hypothetical protein
VKYDCLPLKIRGIKKATWDKRFKSPKRLNSSPEAPREKKKNSMKCSKIKILKKRIKCRRSTNSNRKPLQNLKSQNSNFMEKSNSENFHILLDIFGVTEVKEIPNYRLI